MSSVRADGAPAFAERYGAASSAVATTLNFAVDQQQAGVTRFGQHNRWQINFSVKKAPMH
jgi:hypothetical protein